MPHLILATRNAHKTREFAEILGDKFEVSDLSTLADSPEIKETGKTFAENAILKALAASQDRSASGGLVVADDSGLEVDALGGAPGIYSACYAGHRASDQANVEKLLHELKTGNVSPDKRTARFRCVIAVAHEKELLGTFEGIVEGTVVDLPRGRNGFGYDPIFVPAGLDQTFAELSAEAKNKISHRAKAIAELGNALRSGA